MNHPGGARLEPSPAETDRLLQALLWVCNSHGIQKSHASFLAGLPAMGKLSVEHGVRAMQASGFSVKLAKRDPASLPIEIYPVVLLLKDGGALILLDRTTSVRGPRYELLQAGLDEQRFFLEESELRSLYGGHCLLMKQLPKPGEAGGEEDDEPSGSRWLWQTVWRYRRYYYDSILATVLINVLSTFAGLFTIHVYDRVIPLKAYATLWALVAGVVIALLFEAAARQLRDYLMDLAARKSDITLSSALFSQALGLRLEHTPPSSGAFAHQVRQFETVRDFGTSASLAIVTDLPFSLLFIFMIFTVAGKMAIVPLVAIVISMLIALWIQFPLHTLMMQTFRDQSAMMGVLIESIEGIETLRVTGASGIMSKRYEDLTAATAFSGMKYRILSNIVMTVFNFIQQGQNIVILVWGVYLIHEGELSAGALVGCMMFANRAIGPVGQFVGLATRFQTAKTALGGLNNLMSLPVERDPTRSYLQKPTIDGSIEINNLSFAYPATSGHKPPIALNEVSLKIDKGERVAFVGKIGSGKSTLLRMIAGLYQPFEGQVKVDGIDIRQIDPVDFRNNIGYVTQDLRLFRGTLRENIFLGRPAASMEAFHEVVALTGLDRIADAHPMGYDMPIGTMGLGLSGGQRQLVALARALITRPKILLMDEPTSAMDMQTEALFTKRLEAIVQGRTVIIVTHRPSLLSVVDRVIVMDQQRMVADGPKDRILAMLAGQDSNAVRKEGFLDAGDH
ncbi:MAG: type I secretion system permease/ATPase [Oxalobacteraceae bacterium]|jgi:ATP-binding cassette subfamily C protein LapB|nr:type I secretion system permease/ATPase [Oxalobacteraceae bacterium]